MESISVCSILDALPKSNIIKRNNNVYIKIICKDTISLEFLKKIKEKKLYCTTFENIGDNAFNINTNIKISSIIQVKTNYKRFISILKTLKNQGITYVKISPYKNQLLISYDTNMAKGKFYIGC